MLKKIGIASVVIVVVLVGVSFLLPMEYEVSRSIVIDANSRDVHVYVGDLRKWDEWTPWKDEDPTIKITFGDKTTGIGASQTWVGESGDGELTFTRSDPRNGIAYNMAFDEGRLKSTGSILYTREGDGTTVTWNMKGKMEQVVIGPFFVLMMDSIVGKMYDAGLERLKQKVEGK